MSDQRADPVEDALADLEQSLSPVAEIERRADTTIAWCQVTVRPHQDDALAMAWICSGEEIVFEAGSPGGRCELPRTVAGVETLGRLARAVAEGRVRQIFGLARSCVEFTFEDGTVWSETGYVGWPLPMPGWKRRGRRIEYAPYE